MTNQNRPEIIGSEEYLRKCYEDESPIRLDLEHIGLKVGFVFDLQIDNPDYAVAIPVLFDHVQRPYSDPTLEDLARLLSHPSAIYLWPELVKLYRGANQDESPNFMMGLAVALSEHCLRSKKNAIQQEVINLIRDKSRGESRILLLRCFRRKRDNTSLNLICELSSDPDLAKEIASWQK